MQTISDLTDEEEVQLEGLLHTLALNESDPQVSILKVLPELLRISGRTLLRLRRFEPRFRESEWPWLSREGNANLPMQDANKFLSGCILEFRAGKTDVWDNVTYFNDEILENPRNIWQSIISHPQQEWKDLFWDYNLHPELDVYMRLREIAVLMLRYYHGDARLIWEGYSDKPQEVFRRLSILGIPQSTACLVIGALKDKGYVEGPYEIVGDIVDSRVIARMACGEWRHITAYQARRLAWMICPKDPWILDRPLYVLGMSSCGPGPRCRTCPAKDGCLYAVSERLGIKVGTLVYEALFGRKTVQKSLKNWL